MGKVGCKTTIASKRVPTKQSLVRKLGVYQIFVLPAGILANLGCVTLLAFLWFSNDDNPTWRNIILQSWATRYVAIMSLIIRLVVGAQSVSCVSMLSSLVLEGFETPLPSVAAMSILRFKNGGALDLLFFRFLFHGKPMVKKAALALVAFMLFVMLMSLQFTSTALLSDLGFRNITVQQPESQIAYAHQGVNDPFGAAMPSGSLLSFTPLYPPFIEYSEPPDRPVQGVFDTGTLIRGFLPVADETQRQELVRYSGMATFFDNRVVCAQPSENSTQVRLTISDSMQGVKMFLSGQVDTAIVVPRFNGTTGGSFACSEVVTPPGTNGPVGAGSVEWPLAICQVFAIGGLVSSMQDMPLRPWFDQKSVDTSSDKYLVVNTTGSVYAWERTFSLAPLGGAIQINSTSSRGTGEWLQVDMGFGLGLSISICYVASAGQHRHVDVFRSSADTTEPKALWNISHDYSDGHFETESIRKQLGAVSERQSLSQRGLFQLAEPPESWVTFTANTTYFGQGPGVTVGKLLESILFSANWSSSALCYGCLPLVTPIHFIHGSVFNQIIRDTSSPALALQALLTGLYAQMYYSNAYLFSTRAAGTVWVNVSAVAPVQRLFFSLVVAALATEMLLAICITLVFLSGTRYSSLGNAWQTLLQVAGQDIDQWVSDSSLTDKEIKTLMKVGGLERNLVGLVDVHDMNKIRFRERKPASI